MKLSSTGVLLLGTEVMIFIENLKYVGSHHSTNDHTPCFYVKTKKKSPYLILS